MYTAVLLDISSIQEYIFSSSKFKENIGASFLIENIYNDSLLEISDVVSLNRKDLNDWKENPDLIKISTQDVDMEIVYQGGGNMLLLFLEKEKAESFVREWTKKLLIIALGVRSSIVIENISLKDFKEEKEKLFQKLTEVKRKFHPKILLPKHGITADCHNSGPNFSANYILEDLNHNFQILSSSAIQKQIFSKKADNNLIKKYLDGNEKDYFFPKELDDLGQELGTQNYIAIVHVDGNEIGTRFNDVNTIPKMRRLSVSINESIEGSMGILVDNIINNYESFSKELNLKENCLPIRPMIFGGDDITFVTDGRLGIHFAKEYIEELVRKDISDGKRLSACAGIAIIKSKYPFYHGYRISEQLCLNAKIQAKKENNNSSWLDFHITTGSFSGSIQNTRKNTSEQVAGNLYLRPYRVIGTQNDYKNLLECLKGVHHFISWPKTKIMELRAALYEGKVATQQFIQQIKFRELSLPEIEEYPQYKEEGWLNRETPYYDMIEMIKFYPEFLLEKVLNHGINTKN